MSKIVKISILGLLLSLVIVSPKEEEVIKEEPVLAQSEKIVTLLPELIPICACESTGSATGTPTHFRKGKVIQGKINPLDTGICQINLHYHQADAIKMGLDLWKEQDNIRYANYLYEKQGSQPWNWSRSCWGKKVQE